MTRHNKNYVFLDLCLLCYSLPYGLTFSEYGSDWKLVLGCVKMCTMGALKGYTIMFVFILAHTTLWFVTIWTFYFASFQMCIYVGTCMVPIFYVTLYVRDDVLSKDMFWKMACTTLLISISRSISKASSKTLCCWKAIFLASLSQTCRIILCQAQHCRWHSTSFILCIGQLLTSTRHPSFSLEFPMNFFL